MKEFESTIREALDEHAIVYTRTTKQFITGKIDAAEMDNTLEEIDTESLAAILTAHQLDAERAVREELDALAKLTDSYDGKVQLLANLTERIFRRLRELKQEPPK